MTTSLTAYKKMKLPLPEDDDAPKQRKIGPATPHEQAVTALQNLIANPPENSRVITVTPALAEWVLDLNAHNRPKKPVAIRKYMADMISDRWGLTGDTIKFGTDGYLQDGQNRMYACIKADVPFTTHAVFGINPRLFARIDIGKNRDGADSLAIAGEENAKARASMIRWLNILSKAGGVGLNRGDTLTNEQIVAVNEQLDRGLTELAIKAARAVYVATGTPMSITSALYYAFGAENLAKVETFFAGWEHGNARLSAAAVKLQRTILEMRNVSNNRINDGWLAAVTVKALIDHIAGRAGRGRYQHRMVGDIRDDFPPIPVINIQF